MMRLYGYFRSSTSFRVRMALNLKGLEYEQVSINLVAAEHKGDAYGAINPQGLVPALEHEGRILTQSMAIMEYLDDIAPEPLLVFGRAASKAHIRKLSQIIACDIHPMNNLQVWKGYVGKILGANDAQMQDWYAHWIYHGLSVYEAEIKDAARLYSCGETLSMADLCLLPQLYNARRFHVPLDNYPTILKVEENMLKLEAVQKALPENQPDAPQELEKIYA